MKRGLYIQTNSAFRGMVHQHHYLLLFAWKLKQGLINKTTVEVLKSYIKYFYNQGIVNHLKKEEEIIFNGLVEENLLRKSLEYGHERIKEKVLGIINEPSVNEEEIESLCSTLINVVKYEEKKVIPYLEKKLDSIESSWLRLEMTELNEEIVDEFKPEFWMHKISDN